MDNNLNWSKSELLKLQKFYDKWGKQTNYSAAEFLDMRESLEKLRDMEDPKNAFQNLKKFATHAYNEINKIGRANFSGLKEADEEYEKNRQKRIRLEGINHILFKEDGNPRPESWEKMEDIFQDHESVLKEVFDDKGYSEITREIKVVKALEDIENAKKKFKNKLPYVIGALVFIIFARSNGLTLDGNIDYILAGISFLLTFKPAWVGFGGLFGFIFFILGGAQFDWLIFGFLIGFIVSWPGIIVVVLETYGRFVGKRKTEQK